MKNKVSIKKIDVSVICFTCDGKGCNRCDKGKYKESHYIMTVGNQAIDMDTIK